MSVREYKDSDYELLTALYRSWDMQAPAREFLPNVGAVYEDSCICFLYQTDSAGAYIEGLVVHKYINRGVKDQALSAVLDYLINKAKDLGFKMVIGYTKIDKVSDRVKNKHQSAALADKYTLLKRKL